MEVKSASQLAQLGNKCSIARLPLFMEMRSWISGDCDGNPNATAVTMQHAFVRQGTAIFGFYLQEAHAVSAELSISTLLVGVSPELQKMPVS